MLSGFYEMMDLDGFGTQRSVFKLQFKRMGDPAGNRQFCLQVPQIVGKAGVLVAIPRLTAQTSLL